MALELKNRWRYVGDDRWDWEAFIDDGGTGELSQVGSVQYVLHPTFRNPIRTVTDPSGGFVMKTNGWGTFTMKAFVQKKDGAQVKLAHNVVLSYEPPQGVT